MEERLKALGAAKHVVDPLVEQHGLEPYQMGAPAFTRGSTVTKVDQHIDNLLRVADWLLDKA